RSCGSFCLTARRRYSGDRIRAVPSRAEISIHGVRLRFSEICGWARGDASLLQSTAVPVSSHERFATVGPHPSPYRSLPTDRAPLGSSTERLRVVAVGAP